MRSAFAKLLKFRGTNQVLDIDGAGGVVNRPKSLRVQFRVRAEGDEVLTLEGSTLHTVATQTL